MSYDWIRIQYDFSLKKLSLSKDVNCGEMVAKARTCQITPTETKASHANRIRRNGRGALKLEVSSPTTCRLSRRSFTGLLATSLLSACGGAMRFPLGNSGQAELTERGVNIIRVTSKNIALYAQGNRVWDLT